eukprot:366575_1
MCTTSSSDEKTLMNREEILDTTGSQTLAGFVKESHLQIKCGKLKFKTYRKVVKRLLFELALTMHHLHSDMNYCHHLNITPNSILIENGDIKNGKINSEISMIFGMRSQQSPNISTNEIDMYSFGIIIYYCFIGDYIIEEKDDKAYCATINGKLKQYLSMNNLLKFISPKVLDLLNGLLNINAT